MDGEYCEIIELRKKTKIYIYIYIYINLIINSYY